ncbi:MAG: hypothetical protein VW891_11750, partial [Novosphingobium sp.]
MKVHPVWIVRPPDQRNAGRIRANEPPLEHHPAKIQRAFPAGIARRCRRLIQFNQFVLQEFWLKISDLLTCRK